MGAAGILLQPAPPGSGLGIRNPYAVRLVLEAVSVPVIVAGGIGTASDAALAMELGCHGVLVGTAIADAREPEVMAEAMRRRGSGAQPARPDGSPGASTATPSARPSDPGVDSRRPVPHMTRPDAVVVGAGAIGTGCAYELARAGLRVTVIERGEPAAEASGASAGILSVPDPSRRDPLAVLGR